MDAPKMAPDEALRRIYEAFNESDGSYWADNVLRVIRETMEEAPTLRVRGVGRMADEPRALLVLLTDVPTDNHLREIHDYLREWESGLGEHAMIENDRQRKP